ncbi:hypothetical protein SAMN05444000_103174 [Shimia gijangensis]|uniref:Uncharacterized protein n=1 Tax=Shimia gijangensis TaxID=1470563 RepID=A0A1M6ECZ6_9RHOB|nr:short-chain dehydrogenase [Shimia gijangensis]SHI83190.1 hypothetical protein SAMN05444000_103174 [Shimia gijangensis]
MTGHVPELKSFEQLFFELPPYSQVGLHDHFNVKKFHGLPRSTVKIDGHCPFCSRDSTFVVGFESLAHLSTVDIDNWCRFDEKSLVCARNDAHVLNYFFFRDGLNVQKVGQYPSLADVSNNEVAVYRKGMKKLDANEFHKAIGLAAHGVGVGSFVYLRRVFERLVYGRFEEFKEAEGWKDESFYGVRMEDKIALLEDHLPEFLIENRKIYSILSVGVHELDEKLCLSWFDVMKHSIIIILEDDKKKKEELERRQAFKKAIGDFSSK